MKPTPKARTAKPRCKSSVYTPTPLPPREWANCGPEYSPLQSLIEARCYRGTGHAAPALCLGEHEGPHSLELCGALYADWWHHVLSEADRKQIGTLQGAIAANNSEVSALASGLDLTVKTIEGVLQYDALAMAKRIAAAGARHRNRGPRGHKSANRHLRYECPSCGKALRSASADRIILCGGSHGRPHEAALCIFDPSSQPEYRQADAAALALQDQGADVAPFVGATPAGQSQSQLQSAASKRKAKAAIAVPTAIEVEIPF